MMHRAFLLLSHALSPAQEKELAQDWRAPLMRPMPEALKKLWGNVPPDTPSIGEWVQPVLEWVEGQAAPGDVILVQGDYGATFLTVSWALSKGLVPVYATTERLLEETVQPDGSVLQKRVFRHVRFRRYETPRKEPHESL
ncbi:MAG: CRISPR-associated protein Csx20 [Desulfosoma sp.]